MVSLSLVLDRKYSPLPAGCKVTRVDNPRVTAQGFPDINICSLFVNSQLLFEGVRCQCLMACAACIVHAGVRNVPCVCTLGCMFHCQPFQHACLPALATGPQSKSG